MTKTQILVSKRKLKKHVNSKPNNCDVCVQNTASRRSQSGFSSLHVDKILESLKSYPIITNNQISEMETDIYY